MIYTSKTKEETISNNGSTPEKQSHRNRGYNSEISLRLKSDLPKSDMFKLKKFVKVVAYVEEKVKI